MLLINLAISLFRILKVGALESVYQLLIKNACQNLKYLT